jgi:hypothetical protein
VGQHPKLGVNEVCACKTCMDRHKRTVSRLAGRLKRVLNEPDEALTVEDVQRQLRLAGLLLVLDHTLERRHVDKQVAATFMGDRKLSEVLADLAWLERA